ncbi:MAG: hypothetical protein ACSHWU_02000 [Marinicella sp.]
MPFRLKKLELSIALALSIGAQKSYSQIEPVLNLSSLDGTNGFVINGPGISNLLGRSLSVAGDVNGDGIDDLVIGADGADPNGSSSGSAFVVFGSDSGLPHPLNLSDINGSNGFVINGINTGDHLGSSVSAAGDVNDDGIDDMILGAWGVDFNGDSIGSSYVVFGNSTGFPHPLNLSEVDGTNGFVIIGVNAEDHSGWSASSAGDINGDGIDDVIIGAWGAGPDGVIWAGSSYVVFGDSEISNPFNLSTLNGHNGFVINGVNTSDFSGLSVSAAGDINGDGIDDVIVGAYGANSFSGSSYVVFGSDSGIPNPLNLSDIDGLNGFVINGANSSDWSGYSVSAAGDVNNDGIDDVIVGAFGVDPNGLSRAGSSYVVFGSDSGLSHPLNLSDINGTNGFVLNGVNASDDSGRSVSAAGDVNGDGIDDVIIGAGRSNPNGLSLAGSSYVVFGSKSGLPHALELSDLNGTNGFVINGANTEDRSGVSVSAAGDVNGDGVDDVIIGAPGADPNGISSAGSSYVVFGDDTIFKDGLE